MKIETKIIHHVDYNDLDEAINEFLKEKGCKCDFEFVDAQEFSNNSSYEISVGNKWDTFLTKGKQDEILEGNFSWATRRILQWMHEEGKIPAGDYIIKVSW